MRKNPDLFSVEEYMFLHQRFLKNQEETRLFKRIKAKRGINLSKIEVKHVKKRFEEWAKNNQSEMF